LSRLDASSGDTRDIITTRTLRSLEMKIKGIPGVVDVKFQLLNWKKDKGQWTVATPTE
jgi:hypothetical protein